LYTNNSDPQYTGIIQITKKLLKKEEVPNLLNLKHKIKISRPGFNTPGLAPK
jgi:hypothetical protein